MPVRVVLAEDNLLVREGVAQLLRDPDADVDVVAQCEDFESLVRAVDREQPDVVVTDIRMPPHHTDEGIRLAAMLRERDSRTGVVVLSNYASPAYALALLETGSDGRAYLLKERVHDRGQLVSAIHVVAVGGSMMDPKIVEPLVAARTYGKRSALADLTPREREVLAEIAQGKSNAAIAESLVLTKRAVEKHINAIFMKLGLADSADVSKRVKAALVFLAEADGRP
jgi:DNA-binding NarL/FixJ family response regulator